MTTIASGVRTVAASPWDKDLPTLHRYDLWIAAGALNEETNTSATTNEASCLKRACAAPVCRSNGRYWSNVEEGAHLSSAHERGSRSSATSLKRLRHGAAKMAKTYTRKDITISCAAKSASTANAGKSGCPFTCLHLLSEACRACLPRLQRTRLARTLTLVKVWLLPPQDALPSWSSIVAGCATYFHKQNFVESLCRHDAPTLQRCDLRVGGGAPHQIAVSPAA